MGQWSRQGRESYAIKPKECHGVFRQRRAKYTPGVAVYSSAKGGSRYISILPFIYNGVAVVDTRRITPEIIQSNPIRYLRFHRGEHVLYEARDTPQCYRSKARQLIYSIDRGALCVCMHSLFCPTGPYLHLYIRILANDTACFDALPLRSSKHFYAPWLRHCVIYPLPLDV